MSNFDTAIITILKQEGGYSDYKNDPGGNTNFGITQRTFDVFKAGDTELENIKNVRDLTPEQASYFYKTFFWDKRLYSQIQDQRIATKLFSIAINEGALEATICLQRAIRAVSGVVLNEDGILGRETLDNINGCDSNILLASFKSEIAGKYRGIVQAHPSQDSYLDGWLNRAYS